DSSLSSTGTLYLEFSAIVSVTPKEKLTYVLLSNIKAPVSLYPFTLTEYVLGEVFAIDTKTWFRAFVELNTSPPYEILDSPIGYFSAFFASSSWFFKNVDSALRIFASIGLC